MRTMKELYQECENVQNACNFFAVVNSFARAMADLREHLRAEGKHSTADLTDHPIMVMWLSKIASMTSSEDSITFSRACESVSQALKE